MIEGRLCNDSRGEVVMVSEGSPALTGVMTGMVKERKSRGVRGTEGGGVRGNEGELRGR